MHQQKNMICFKIINISNIHKFKGTLISLQPHVADFDISNQAFY